MTESENIQRQVQIYVELPKEARQLALLKIEQTAEKATPADAPYFLELFDALVNAENQIEKFEPPKPQVAQVREFTIEDVAKVVVPCAKIVGVGYGLYFVGGLVVALTKSVVGFVAAWGGWIVAVFAAAVLFSNLRLGRKGDESSESFEEIEYYRHTKWEKK